MKTSLCNNQALNIITTKKNSPKSVRDKAISSWRNRSVFSLFCILPLYKKLSKREVNINQLNLLFIIIIYLFFFFAVACILQYFNFLLKFSFLNKKSERQGKVRFPRWLLYRPPIFTGNPAHLSLSLSFFCCQRCSYMLLNRSVLKASPVIRCWNTAVETNIGHVLHTLDLLLALKIFFKFKFKHFFIL